MLNYTTFTFGKQTKRHFHK